MRQSSRSIRLLGAAAVFSVLLSGCSLFSAHYSPPSQRLVPEVIGVIDHAEPGSPVFTEVLSDGRRIPVNTDFNVNGGLDKQGDLLLASNTNRFAFALERVTSHPGECWEALVTVGDHQLAWDEGDSILFGNGIVLRKAANFKAERQPELIDGRLIWAITPGLSPQPVSFCAMRNGEIAWAKEN